MSSEKWFDEYAGMVYSYILLLVRNEHIAEDLTQETFMKVVANEQAFKGESSVKTWIFRIAYTTTMSHFRKEKPFATLFDVTIVDSNDAFSPEKALFQTSLQKQFYDALSTLKPSYRQVILLRKINGFSTKETSYILKCSEGNVKMRLTRALAAFKKELENGGITSETFIG
ncbi:MAG TPA: RNA polymerase sigma factor [Sporosarcina sp.]|nr:RNA polymerase sigma factor [Sporosarcina sp.]